MKTFNTFNQNKGLHRKLGVAYKFGTYFLKLYYGILTRRIYFNVQNSVKFDLSSLEVKNTLDIIDDSIRNFLRKIPVGNYLSTLEKYGFEHIGYGCFATRKFGRIILLTQGNAVFFFSTSKGHTHMLKIILRSIVKNSVKIMIEDFVLQEFNLSPLTKKKMTVEINASLIKSEISKITISTDRLWSLQYLDEKQHNIPVGLEIILIEVIKKNSS